VLRRFHHWTRSRVRRGDVGYFTAPYEVRAKLGKPVVDREHKQVRVAAPGGDCAAVYLGDQDA
jgi:hypothetical protein